MIDSQPYRALIAGLAAMGTVTLRGQDYSGPYLSTMLAHNPELPDDEKRRNAQLISEFGRLTAAALFEKQMAEVSYRIWRETQVFELVTDIETAINMGALPDGATKFLAKTSARDFVRTLPEYKTHMDAVLAAEECWGTLHAAYTAAQARKWEIHAIERSGGTAAREAARADRPFRPIEAARRMSDDGTVIRHPGHGDEEDIASYSRVPAAEAKYTHPQGRSVLTVTELEAQVKRPKRNPIPAPPPGGSMPPPPRSRIKQ